ncbi:aminotransferase class I/II-fold pyridoxal phosphate-dependent enzyme [Ruminococcaceae bacterium OttesenSCG-928-D13]|nr:aminotransferase class I/II-fold pyridoxal phosphate-dependent enzyme [Ruminococcaceae bacterium OttesenSCG-928-D13]
MSDYLAMDKATLAAERDQLQAAYEAFAQKGLKLDMSRGKPAPQQLDLSMDLLKIEDYKDADGMDTRNYGGLEGCSEARAYFGEMLGTPPEKTLVAGNSSLNMMYHVIDLGYRKGFSDSPKPWKDCGTIKFLCPSPGYDRHFRITEDFGFELVLVDMTPEGPDMDQVEKLAQDEAVKGLWCVPVYSNPDGYTCSAATVERLAKMKTAAPDFRIMWDNAYGVHHLTDAHEGCPNLLAACEAAGNPNRAVMFCSTSKITFAGGGVGAVGLSDGNMADLKKYLFPMTISYDKTNQLRHVRFLQKVGLEQLMKKHAGLLKPKFDAVAETLQAELGSCGEIARWTKPKGGYFISLYLMEGCASRVVALCKQAGVVLTGAGAAYPYGKDPKDSHIRIAPSFPTSEELKQAAELLCIAARLASVEKLLAS